MAIWYAPPLILSVTTFTYASECHHARTVQISSKDKTHLTTPFHLSCDRSMASSWSTTVSTTQPVSLWHVHCSVHSASHSRRYSLCLRRMVHNLPNRCQRHAESRTGPLGQLELCPRRISERPPVSESDHAAVFAHVCLGVFYAGAVCWDIVLSLIWIEWRGIGFVKKGCGHCSCASAAQEQKQGTGRCKRWSAER